MQRLLNDAIAPHVSRIAIVGTLVGGVLLATDRAPEPSRTSVVQGQLDFACVEPAAPARVEPARSELAPIALERRWLRGPMVSVAEVNAALGVDVEAWQEFLYTHDASARFAIATEVYSSASSIPMPAFFVDRDGGIWALDEAASASHLALRAEILYTRDIYLLPTGSHFRGILKRS
jgi:hypothetical protein